MDLLHRIMTGVFATVLAIYFGAMVLEVDVEDLVVVAPKVVAFALKGILSFLWDIIPYLVVGYIVIEQFRVNHNLSVLRRSVEQLRNEKYSEY